MTNGGTTTNDGVTGGMDASGGEGIGGAVACARC